MPLQVKIKSPEGGTLNTANTYIEDDINIVPNLQNKTITQNGEYTADEGYAGLGNINIQVAGEGGIDTSQDTVTANTMLEGTTAHDASGNQIIGTILAYDGMVSGGLAYIGGGSSLPAAGTSAEDCTWDEIKAISEAGKGAEYFDLGDEKTITLIDGTEVVMQIVAFNADTLASDNTQTAGITWISKGIITTHVMNSTATNTNGWVASEMRTWLQGTFYNTLPSDVKSSIVSVNKTYYDYTTGSTLTCTDNVWIPSYREVIGGLENAGAQYLEFFNNNNSRIKYNSIGIVDIWWLRTSNLIDNTKGFYSISTSGNWFGSQYASNLSRGVVLGFCT